MITFDLQCAVGHSFEGWFEDADDLEQQLREQKVLCPICDSSEVHRVPSTFAIGGRRRSEPDHQMAAQMLGRAFHKYLKENFENVGAKFADEALKMHYGVGNPRNIRGVSTPQEEEMLRKEGIKFAKITTETEFSLPQEESSWSDADIQNDDEED